MPPSAGFFFFSILLGLFEATSKVGCFLAKACNPSLSRKMSMTAPYEKAHTEQPILADKWLRTGQPRGDEPAQLISLSSRDQPTLGLSRV